MDLEYDSEFTFVVNIYGYKKEEYLLSDNVNNEVSTNKSTPIIEVIDARKIYKVGNERVLALDGVSFTINEGEFCSLLGTSGSR